MSGSDEDIDAALFAAGALTGAEHAALRARMEADPALARRVADWEQALAPIAGHLAPLAPPDTLLDRIDARLDAAGRGHVIRAAEGQWIEVVPGIRVKMLHEDTAARRRTMLLAADPGAVNPPHTHDADEVLVMLSGDLTIDGNLLGPGDCYFSPALCRHPMETTRDGCTCVITRGF